MGITRNRSSPCRSGAGSSKAGVALAAAPLVAGVAGEARGDQPKAAAGTGPFPVRAYGVTSATGRVGPLQIQRRALGPQDLLLDVLYSGICHSDLHTAHSDWRQATYPCVPGHELVGRVAAVGSAVTRFRVCDIGGVGCMVDSCGT